MSKALIFTEHSPIMGLGHLRRSEALKEFLESHEIATTIISNDFSREHISGVYDFIAIDSYHCPLEFYHLVATSAKKAIFFDDTLRLDYPKGTLLNGSMGAHKIPYPIRKDLQLWTGISYALLRKEFRGTPKKRLIKPMIQNVLLSFGGSQMGQEWRRVVEKILTQHYPLWNLLAIDPSKNLDSYAIKSLMEQSCIALSGAGGTLNELAFCGVPTVSFCMVENQRFNFEAWQESGALLSCKKHHKDKDFELALLEAIEQIISRPKRQELSLKAQTLMEHNHWQTYDPKARK